MVRHPKPAKRIVDERAMEAYCVAHPHCEVLGCAVAPQPQPHHLVSRKMHGDDAPSNFLRLCKPMHAEWHAIGGRSWLMKYAVRLTAEARGKIERALRVEPETAIEDAAS